MFIKEQYDIIKAVKTLTSVFAAFIFLRYISYIFFFPLSCFPRGLAAFFSFGMRTYDGLLMFYKNSAEDEMRAVFEDMAYSKHPADVLLKRHTGVHRQASLP